MQETLAQFGWMSAELSTAEKKLLTFFANPSISFDILQNHFKNSSYPVQKTLWKRQTPSFVLESSLSRSEKVNCWYFLACQALIVQVSFLMPNEAGNWHFLLDIYTQCPLTHFSQFQSLCSMKSSSKTLENLPYFIYTKTQSCFFHFSFRATLCFPLMNAQFYVDIDLGIH